MGQGCTIDTLILALFKSGCCREHAAFGFTGTGATVALAIDVALYFMVDPKNEYLTETLGEKAVGTMDIKAAEKAWTRAATHEVLDRSVQILKSFLRAKNDGDEDLEQCDETSIRIVASLLCAFCALQAKRDKFGYEIVLSSYALFAERFMRIKPQLKDAPKQGERDTRTLDEKSNSGEFPIA